jgi:DNA-binding GntR family transcriptional regulator
MLSTSPIPLYHRLYSVLRQRVEDGLYPPGGQLPTEDELAAEFDVSRATVRQAVGELVAAGIVSRRQGRGTFVLEEPHARLGQGFAGNLGDLIREGRRTTFRNVTIEHGREVASRIAKELRLTDSHVTLVRRTRLLDGVPFGYTEDYFTPEVGKVLNGADLSAVIPRDLLAESGHDIASATQTIRAQLSDVAVSEALSIPLGSAVLFVERLSCDAGGAPLVFVQSWYRGDMYEFKAALSLQDVGTGELLSQFA